MFYVPIYYKQGTALAFVPNIKLDDLFNFNFNSNQTVQVTILYLCIIFYKSDYFFKILDKFNKILNSISENYGV